LVQIEFKGLDGGVDIQREIFCLNKRIDFEGTEDALKTEFHIWLFPEGLRE